MVLSKSAAIDIDTLPREIVGLQYDGGEPMSEPQANTSHKKTLGDLEREHILDVLHTEGNNRTAAFRVLGISRSTLQDKLKNYGVT